MKQLSQKLKDGAMQVVEVPVPDLQEGMVLVRNYYSLISAGTESSTVRAARKGLIGKAKERPQQLRQVFQVLKSQGPLQTYRAVMKKLDAWSPLGYSCVGELIDIGSNAHGFAVGDWVACAGLSACHAEVVAVPANLCVRLPDIEGSTHRATGREKQAAFDEYLKCAAYNTLGAIALQGVRQADLRLGESCTVIGLGLLGQLTCMLLRAAGVRTAGVDTNPGAVETARRHCTDVAILRDTEGVEEKILSFTGGIGCDGVIITAATGSLDPINLAGALARKRGTVVVVGAVPTGFDREPHFYRKELQVRMSCSYGPGRYDPEYEEKGRDYPVGYVRWTENRNMQAFQQLVASGIIDPSYLTTHVFKLDDAPKAYDLILEKSEPFLGILIEYDREKTFEPRIVQVAPIRGKRTEHRSKERIKIGFIGAGSYAQSHLLPNIPNEDDVVLKGVMTATSASARSVAERYGFEFCSGNAGDILNSHEINTVFIASRHDSHSKYVAEALRAGKHVFVEKPLCLKFEELLEIESFFIPEEEPDADPTSPPASLALSPPLLMVGYNRRFSPLSGMLRERMGKGPHALLCRVNAGAIPPGSWIQDKEVGGGRILGEVCHFVDYLTYLSGSRPLAVTATAMDDPFGHQDTLAVSLRYANGSIGTIQYFSNGSKDLPKEYVEVHSHGLSAVLKDFREIEIYGKGKPYRKKLLSQDKGQKEEVRDFLETIRKGSAPPIPIDEIFSTSRVCFAILESLRYSSTIRLV